jgi:hypothetical protein
LNLTEGFRGPDPAFFLLNVKAALRARSNPKRVVANLSGAERKPQAQSEIIGMSPRSPTHVVDAAPLSQGMFK